MVEKILHLIYWLLESMRGGAESLESLDDELDAMLDLARSPQSATTTTTGAEQTLYDIAAQANPWYYCGSSIDLSNMGAAHQLRIRVYVRNRAAGGLVRVSDDTVNTYAGVQDPAMKQIDGFYNQYGARITMQLLAGANIDIHHEHWDMARGS